MTWMKKIGDQRIPRWPTSKDKTASSWLQYGFPKKCKMVKMGPRWHGKKVFCSRALQCSYSMPLLYKLSHLAWSSSSNIDANCRHSVLFLVHLGLSQGFPNVLTLSHQGVTLAILLGLDIAILSPVAGPFVSCVDPSWFSLGVTNVLTLCLLASYWLSACT